MSTPAGGLTILGGPGTGKTTLLRSRMERARAELGPNARIYDALEPLAFDVYAEIRGTLPVIVDDVLAERLFRDAARPLLALEWEELGSEIDVEVSAMRSPDRFLDATFRLIRKLREAEISPETFLQCAMRGATSFYAEPPNLSHPDLLLYTKEGYRDSLEVDAETLRRQHRREVDLSKIVAKLYRTYLDALASADCATARDVIADLVPLLRERADVVRAVRERPTLLFLDDAHDLTAARIALLRALFGDDLHGVTLAGDPRCAFGAFDGARPKAALSLTPWRVELGEERRCAPRIAAVRERILAPRRPAGSSEADASDAGSVIVRRFQSLDEEAHAIAEIVRGWLDEGLAPERIAVIFRSVGAVRTHEEAMLAREIPVQVVGDANPFLDPRAMDALALLWWLEDPFEHAWALRVLEGPLRLADATIATLCGRPEVEVPLFADEEFVPRTPPRDPLRAVRLGWNLLTGACDPQLSPLARRRLDALRAVRRTLLDEAPALHPCTLAARIWKAVLPRDGTPGSARARSQQIVLRRLLGRMRAFFDAHPRASLRDFLDDVALRAETDLESCSEEVRDGCVLIASVEATRGREFDAVVVAGVQPGSFPRWYVPDAFLFSPQEGMIPKDDAGGTASRTAKCTYFLFRNKTRERYNEEERKALAYAVSRARDRVVLTGWGRPTSGLSAPEFLEELRGPIAAGR